MDTQQRNALARIRQACSLGLPGRTLMPMLMADLRRMIPAVCGQFTWSSADGALSNHWSDHFMPRRTAWIIVHRRQYEADAGTTFGDLVRFGLPTGNLRAWWPRGFEHSQTYTAVFEPYGFKWVLDGVVRDAMRPWGCLLLIRNIEDPDFTRAEEALLGRVLPFIAHALRSEALRPRRFVRTGRSALLVCSEGGDVLEWSADAHRLAVWALVDRIDTEASIGDGDFHDVRWQLREIVQDCVRQLERLDAGAPLPEIVRRNGWGEFIFRAYRLVGAGDAAPRIGLLIEQCVPLEARLLENVNTLELTPRQKEVVLLTGRGLPNAQIARDMRITVLTLKDHLKDIYARLGVGSREQLLERITAP